jgi:hypothetical protein
VTTLRKSHVSVRGTRVTFRFRAKGKAQVRTAIVDAELAESIRALLGTPGSQLFRYEVEGELHDLKDRRLNDYVKEFMGEGFAELLRLAGGRRAVSRRPNDRGFPPPEFADRLRPRYRPRPGGECDALAAPLLANTRGAQSGIVFAL